MSDNRMDRLLSPRGFRISAEPCDVFRMMFEWRLFHAGNPVLRWAVLQSFLSKMPAVAIISLVIDTARCLKILESDEQAAVRSNSCPTELARSSEPVGKALGSGGNRATRRNRLAVPLSHDLNQKIQLGRDTGITTGALPDYFFCYGIRCGFISLYYGALSTWALGIELAHEGMLA
jgi:hypothetical protein